MYTGRRATVIDLLSNNTDSENEYIRATQNKHDDAIKPLTEFRQSFESAWKEFEVIAKNTIGVIVPYERGAGIIAELYALPDPKCCMELLREAQQYSVNIYSSNIDIKREKSINKVPLETDMEIYTVDEKYYDQNMGLIDEAGKMSCLGI
ncbi:hypothetical protein AGMMS50229_17610 [Campylobacterota bacterium]|nr:hypothetical protein AGMMS50229_17610 [Campylobacterota bacterium]